jgi:hypothetical protein
MTLRVQPPAGSLRIGWPEASIRSGPLRRGSALAVSVGDVELVADERHAERLVRLAE